MAKTATSTDLRSHRVSAYASDTHETIDSINAKQDIAFPKNYQNTGEIY